MLLIKKLDWIEPCKVAKNIDRRYSKWSFLHSSTNNYLGGRYSYIAFDIKEEFTLDKFSEIDVLITENKSSSNSDFYNRYFGYFSYELITEEGIAKLGDSQYLSDKFPISYLAKYHFILLFDHETKQVSLYQDILSKKDYSDIIEILKKDGDFEINQNREDDILLSALSSNMSDSQYINKINYIKERIADGDIYQANLTRKYFGQIKDNIEKIDLFIRLCQISPSPYSAFIKIDNKYILSSSPERFLKIQNDKIMSSPIKGSVKRDLDNKESDDKLKQKLNNSEKDKSENLMIVDLMRNDIAKSSQVGTVRVENLFRITTHKTIHHMSSDIIGHKRADISMIKIIENAFPPGSMTGAPKKKAIEICAELENSTRGVYSGAIGYLNNKECDLSVVIRTIIFENNQFEFQVGGGIVNESIAENELEEIMAKSFSIRKLLGIKE